MTLLTLQQEYLQVRAGEVLDYGGRLLQVVKREHTQGAGRQLGNVQVLQTILLELDRTLAGPNLCFYHKLGSTAAKKPL